MTAGRSSPSLKSNPTPPERQRESVWQVLHYTLAFFNVVAVLLSVYLMNEMVRSYRDAVQANDRWNRRLQAYTANEAFAAGSQRALPQRFGTLLQARRSA